MKSPWSYKKWKPETYIAFHALRTYTAILCTKQNGEVVVSLRVIRTKAKLVAGSNALKAAFREFIKRYADSITVKKKHYIIINCGEFFLIDSKALSYLEKHREMKYLDKIDNGLKKIFDWLFK